MVGGIDHGSALCGHSAPFPTLLLHSSHLSFLASSTLLNKLQFTKLHSYPLLQMCQMGLMAYR